MDVDPVANKLYYTEHQGNTVSRANYDGSLTELLYQGRFNEDFPADVAVDHDAGLVFMTIQSVPTLLNGSLVRRHGEVTCSRGENSTLGCVFLCAGGQHDLHSRTAVLA
jgi:hypothetical protein